MAQKQSLRSDDWVEEEHLVLVELTGVLDYQYFAKSDKECKVLGIETENPVLQFGNYVFKGEYKKAMGTAVIFEQGNEGEEKNWKYKCCTDKMLEMKRVFLQPKENPSDEPKADASKPMDSSTDSTPLDTAQPQTDT